MPVLKIIARKTLAPRIRYVYDQSIDSEDNKDDQDDENILTLENSENCHDEEFNDLEQDIDDELVNNEAEETKAVLKKVSVLLTKVRGISRLARKSNIILIVSLIKSVKGFLLWYTRAPMIPIVCHI